MASLHHNELTYWGRDKMAAISQMTFSNAFSWIKMYEFQEKFTKVCSYRSNWQYSSIGSDNGLVPNRWQAIFWTNGGLVYWCIYASLGLNELINMLWNIIRLHENPLQCHSRKLWTWALIWCYRMEIVHLKCRNRDKTLWEDLSDIWKVKNGFELEQCKIWWLCNGNLTNSS